MFFLLLSHTAVLLRVTAQHNLTPFGTAKQSSTYRSGIPQNAINPPVSNAFSLDICTHTDIGSIKPAWWMFQFSFGIAYITDITIYYRVNFAHRMDGFKLYVTNSSTIPPDGYLCYEDPNPGLPNTTITIPCYQIGQYIIYYDTTGDDLSQNGPLVELCYVAINGCQKGFWGSNCEKVCSKYCIERNCYPGNGSCVWGCNTENCLNDICSILTGVCTAGCKERRTGDHCNEYNIASDGLVSQYPSGNQPASFANDGNKRSCSKIKGTNVTFQVDLKKESIVTGVYITFGENTTKVGSHTLYTSNTSNFLKNGTILYDDQIVPTRVNFSAVFRYLTYVMYVSPVHGYFSELEVCEIGILGCPPTYYGPVCNKSCPRNCHGPCDLETGNCIFGCLNGWTGDNCKQACNDGFYGNNCLQKCSPFCLHQPCDHGTGKCLDGCIRGLQGFNCTQVSVHTAESDNEVTTRIGMFSGGVLLGILITVVVCLVIRKKRQLRKKQTNGNTIKKKQSHDQQHYDDVRMENVSTYQDLRRDIGSSEYDQINTSYVNH
ncbi:unnamed protein product [Mytilus coruscus]|uniref:MEGF10_11 n=1 Tax=Mytilus coruscus TaxID=42192 RepID=A0A6J8EAP3_MYTCO|nr:unnamed protein product [Mytilus coruscus]